MSTEVFSTPNGLNEFDEEFDQFFSTIPAATLKQPQHQQLQPQEQQQQLLLQYPPQQQQMFMQHPPEQPLFDSLQFLMMQSDGQSGQLPDARTVVKQEKESGFLMEWDSHSQQQQDELDRCSPEDRDRIFKAVKEELHCKIKLKLMAEGRDDAMEVEDQSTKTYEISEETRKMQQARREKNKEAARKCRQKKKVSEREQEQKIRQKESEIRQMQQLLDQSNHEYLNVLECFKHSVPCFLAYLKTNRAVLHNPQLRQILQQFCKAQGWKLAPNMGPGVCTANHSVQGFCVEQ